MLLFDIPILDFQYYECARNGIEGGYRNFDVDSSPIVWEHYRTVYKAFFEKYSIDTVNLELELNPPSLIAKSSGNILLEPDYRFRGDTDFNFNHKKGHYPFLKKIIEVDKKVPISHKVSALAQLERCRIAHHTLKNFSLMPRTGKMQNTKNSCKNDRVDVFLYHLKEFYDACKDFDKYEDLSNAAGEMDLKVINGNGRNKDEDKKLLFSYLMTFRDGKNKDPFYNYCESIYFINQKDCDRMVDLGKEITEKAKSEEFYSFKDAVSYMNLAEYIWKARAEAMEKYYDR